jgi:CPA1 family monovalent cation:H+ antiporter
MNEFIKVVLEIFSFSLLSVLIFDLAKRFKIPYTVLLVIVGSLLYFLIPMFDLHFLLSFNLTPDLLFYVFLPILLFESAYQIKISEVKENICSISALAIVSLLISALIIGVGVYFLLGLLGIHIPFIVSILFGVLISATDPVAVLSLFKDYGVPKRLALIFEGESVFNDGSSYSAFLIVLGIAIAIAGGQSFSGGYITDGIAMFLVMMLGGILVGALLGKAFQFLLDRHRKDKELSLTIMLSSAHLTFILSEVLSQNLLLFGHQLHISPIISTAVCALYIGEYVRNNFDINYQKIFSGFWGYFAFFSNSLVFLLMGLLFMGTQVPLNDLIMPIIVTILVVIVARAISVYAVVAPLNKVTKEEKIPANWQHLLAWGSLRGALAIIMAIMIPENFTLPDWNYSFTIRDFLIALTIGCIYFTLLIKALTIPGAIKRLKILEDKKMA